MGQWKSPVVRNAVLLHVGGGVRCLDCICLLVHRHSIFCAKFGLWLALKRLPIDSMRPTTNSPVNRHNLYNRVARRP